MLKYADTHKIAANTAIIVISTVVNLFFICVFSLLINNIHTMGAIPRLDEVKGD